MSGDGIKVNHGSVAEGSGFMRQAVNKMQTRLEQLNNDVKALGAEWDGQAKDAYELAQREWNQEIAELNMLLQQSAVTLDQANEDWVNTDKSTALYFNR